jgi:hypothetical protein
VAGGRGTPDSTVTEPDSQVSEAGANPRDSPRSDLLPSSRPWTAVIAPHGERLLAAFDQATLPAVLFVRTLFGLAAD